LLGVGRSAQTLKRNIFGKIKKCFGILFWQQINGYPQLRCEAASERAVAAWMLIYMNY